MLPLLRIALAGVFALAGITKLLDPQGSRRSMVDFGLPDGAARLAAYVLPSLELVVAVALLPAATAVYGSVGAAVLLLAFIAAIGVSLARGRRPDCHCFGQLHSAPIGWPLLARNAALLVAAGVIVTAGGTDGGGSLSAWFQALPLGGRVAFAGAILAIWLLLWRRSTRPAATPNLNVRQDLMAGALPVGSQAPDFSLPALDGEAVTLEMLRASGKPVALIFISPACGSCMELLPDIERWQRDHAHTLTVAVVTRDTVEANRAKLGDRVIVHVLRQADYEVSTAFGTVVTPAVVFVDARGIILRPPVIGDGTVRQAVDDLITRAEASATLHFPADDFTLRDLEGRQISLTQVLGRPTVLLFWDPNCSFCREVTGHIRLWEARPLTERPRMLVVSKGTTEANAELGLLSPHVLDEGFRVGLHFGLVGTPSAVLLDDAGRMAGPAAVGGAAVLALLGQSELQAETSGCPPESDTLPSDATLAAHSRPRRFAHVQDELLADGSLLLYNSCRRQVMTLNPTGALVWEYCDGEQAVSDIVAEVSGLFPNATTTDSDVRALLDSLLRDAWITAVPQHATIASVE